MDAVITGGAGFLGQLLARRLLAGAGPGPGGPVDLPVDKVVLADLQEPSGRELSSDPRVEVLVVDGLTDPRLSAAVATSGETVVFHLAAMVSAGCEADFDGAWRVNVEGTRALLEACRPRSVPARLVFASSIVAYGGLRDGEVAGDDTRLRPSTTYGATKLIGELLVNDYSRKGYVDGRSARLPTVIIRPGPPNAAASGWVSGILREPLHGQPTVVPVDPALSLPVAGYRSVVENLVRVAALDATALGADRALNLPSVDATPLTMRAALEGSAEGPLGEIGFEVNAATQRFFDDWAHHAAFERATALGLVGAGTLESIVAEYIEDHLASPRVG